MNNGSCRFTQLKKIPTKKLLEKSSEIVSTINCPVSSIEQDPFSVWELDKDFFDI